MGEPVIEGNENVQPNHLWDTFFRSIQVLGVDKTNKALNDALHNTLHVNQGEVSFIIEIVSKEFKITMEEILYGTTTKHSKNKHGIGRGFVIFYLHEPKIGLDYSFENIGKLFNKNKVWAFRYYKKVSHLSKPDCDHPLMKHKNKLDSLILEYRLNKNNEKK